MKKKHKKASSELDSQSELTNQTHDLELEIEMIS